jgi:carboxylate-amine ligase
MIDFGREAEAETRELLGELLEFISTEVDELGSQKEMAHVEKILSEGTGADRQIAAWERQHNMHDVVDLIVDETYERLSVTPADGVSA